jgi:hypothetical protein
VKRLFETSVLTAVYFGSAWVLERFVPMTWELALLTMGLVGIVQILWYQ